MALFGRESDADRQRAERVRSWIRARTPFSLFSCLFGIVSVLDAFTLVIGLSAGVVAIVLAVLGLRDLREQPDLRGRRLCYAGIALGLAGVAMSVIMWTVIYPMIAKR